MLIWTAILLFICKLGSRRQIRWLLRSQAHVVVSHIIACTKGDVRQLHKIPHDDTITDLFINLIVEQLERVQQAMIKELIRKRALEFSRLLGKYYMIAFDGSGLFCRKERHCEYCLVNKNEAGETIYYHYVLEAKLITPNGMALSVASEHIENKEGETSNLNTEKGKQDCEINGFKRLVVKIKEAFPKLPICILVDSLYAARPIFDICKEYDWQHIATFKEGSIPSVYEEFESLRSIQSDNRCTWTTEEVTQKIAWGSDIEYHTHKLHMIECLETCTATNKTTRFLFLTSIHPTSSSICALTNEGGRQRWKIENQGFNMQKNGGYGLEHVFSHNDNAAKCFHLCMQIAHCINQLLEKGGLLGSIQKKYGSIKNVAAMLLDAFRYFPITLELHSKLFENPFQIRLNFNSS